MQLCTAPQSLPLPSGQHALSSGPALLMASRSQKQADIAPLAQTLIAQQCADALSPSTSHITHPAIASMTCAGTHGSHMTQVVNLGALTFVEQIRAVHDAAVLTGISGSDLVNGIFLPSRGVLVEVDPQNRGAQV